MATTVPPSEAPRRKLSYKEQRELDALPERIAALEAEQAALSAELGEGSLYGTNPARAADVSQRLVAVEEEWLAALERQEALGTR
jgi:ABC transport system ATP-binding/permease protein